MKDVLKDWPAAVGVTLDSLGSHKSGFAKGELALWPGTVTGRMRTASPAPSAEPRYGIASEVVVGLDFAELELRLLAQLSDRSIMQISSGDDVYGMTPTLRVFSGMVASTLGEKPHNLLFPRILATEIALVLGSGEIPTIRFPVEGS